MKKYIAGIDLGTNSICITLGEVENGELKFKHISTYESRGISKGKIVNINDVAESIKETVSKIIDTYGNNVIWYIGISNNCVQYKKYTEILEINNGYGIITENEIINVLRSVKSRSADNDEMIYYDIESCTVNGVRKTEVPLGASCDELSLDVVCFYIKKDYYYTIKNSLMIAGISKFQVYLNSYELKDVVLNNHNDEKNVLLVDVGADTINYFLFFRRSIIDMGFVQIGGNSITSDLSICGKLDKQDAEKVKLKYSGCYRNLYKQKLIGDIQEQALVYDINLYKDVVQARIEEMFMIIKKQISDEYFKQIQKIYIFGLGIVEFDKVELLLEDKLKKKVINMSEERLELSDYKTLNSICLVKSAFDRLKWYSEDNDELNLKKNNEELDNRLEKDKNKNSVISKFKKLLDDIF